MLVKDGIDEYLFNLRVIQNKSNNTVELYSINLKKYLLYLNELNILNINEINYNVISDYLMKESIKCTNATINNYVTTLRNFHRFICGEHDDLIDPTIFIKSSKTASHLPSFFTQEQMDTLLNSFDDNNEEEFFNHLLLEFLYGCGVRVSEMCSLKLSDLHLINCTIKIKGKGDKQRIIPVHHNLIDMLNKYLNEYRKNYIKSNPFVFIKMNGKVITRQYVHTIIKQQLEKIGFSNKYSAHSFRHSYATHLLEEDADLRSVQELLGHSDIKTTQIYTHLQTKKLQSTYENYFPRRREKK